MAKLFFAHEEIDEVVAPVADQELPVELVEEVAEVSEDSGELMTATEELEESVAPVVNEQGEATGEEGPGLDETGAEVANIVVESICERLGLPKSKAPVLATENFGSKATRRMSTHLATEGIKETVVKAWARIKEFFMNLYNKIKEFLSKLFDANKRMGATVAAMEEKVKKFEAAGKAEDFVNPGVYKAFALPSGFGMQSVRGVLGNHVALTDSLGQIGAEIAGALEKIGVLAEKPKDMTGEQVDKIIEQAHVVGAIQPITGKSKQLVNGTYFIVNTESAGVKDSKGYIRVDEYNFWKENKADASAKIKALSKSEMEEVLKEVKELVAKTDALKATAGGIDKAQKALDKAISSAIKMAQKNTDGDDAKKAIGEKGGDALKSMRRAVSDLAACNAKMAQRVPALNVIACKAGLAYVTASMKQYKAK